MMGFFHLLDHFIYGLLFLALFIGNNPCCNSDDNTNNQYIPHSLTPFLSVYLSVLIITIQADNSPAE